MVVEIMNHNISRWFQILCSPGAANKMEQSGFKYFLFSSLLGEMIQFDKDFSNGLKPPTRYVHYSYVYPGSPRPNKE